MSCEGELGDEDLNEEHYSAQERDLPDEGDSTKKRGPIRRDYYTCRTQVKEEFEINSG